GAACLPDLAEGAGVERSQQLIIRQGAGAGDELEALPLLPALRTRGAGQDRALPGAGVVTGAHRRSLPSAGAYRPALMIPGTTGGRCGIRAGPAIRPPAPAPRSAAPARRSPPGAPPP